MKIVKKNAEKFKAKMSYAYIGVRSTQVAGNAGKKKSFIVLEKPDDRTLLNPFKAVDATDLPDGDIASPLPDDSAMQAH